MERSRLLQWRIFAYKATSRSSFKLLGNVKSYKPVRSYERYPVSKAIKNDLVGKEFGYDPTAKGTTAQYKKYLKEHNEKFKDFQYRPSKYTKVEKFLPQILLDKPPFYIKKSSFEYFNFPKHNTFLYENRFRTKK